MGTSRLLARHLARLLDRFGSLGDLGSRKGRLRLDRGLDSALALVLIFPLDPVTENDRLEVSGVQVAREE